MTLNHWSAQLETVALLGTARRPAPPLPAELSELVSSGDAQELLLGQAALADVIARAGCQPVHAEAIQPAAPENLPAAGTQAAQLLKLLLSQSPLPAAERDELIVLWLNQASSHGRIVPPELLIELCNLAKSSVPIRAAAPSAWGNRGTWLARFVRGLKSSAEAASVSQDPAELAQVWGQLTSTVAVERLRSLRETDPAGGLVTVQQVWPNLAANERAAVLRCLVEQQHPADDEFLELALDDKAKRVREAALEGLSQLPSSAWAARMGQRLLPAIQYRKGLLRSSLEVVPIDLIDDQWQRDGLPKPNADGTAGLTALDQVISSAPLACWEETTSQPPEAIVKLIAKQPSVLNALAKAVSWQENERWAEALMKHHPKLVRFVSQEVLLAWVRRELPSSNDRELLSLAVGRLAKPWPIDISEALLHRAADPETERRVGSYLAGEIHGALPQPALKLAEELAARAEPATPEQVRTLLLRCVQYQRFHQSILEAFDD